MEVGCNTYSLRGVVRSEALAQLRALAFTAAELWVGHANYLSIGVSARQVAAEAARCGIALRAYCIGGLFGLRPRVPGGAPGGRVGLLARGPVRPAGARRGGPPGPRVRLRARDGRAPRHRRARSRGRAARRRARAAAGGPGRAGDPMV